MAIVASSAYSNFTKLQFNDFQINKLDCNPRTASKSISLFDGRNHRKRSPRTPTCLNLKSAFASICLTLSAIAKLGQLYPELLRTSQLHKLVHKPVEPEWSEVLGLNKRALRLSEDGVLNAASARESGTYGTVRRSTTASGRPTEIVKFKINS